MGKRIDAHHHLWRYSAEEYGWIDETMAVLKRDFLPSDLMVEMRKARIDGAITVQARQTLEETRWLLDLAEQTDTIAGVVGWAPLVEENFIATLAELPGRSKLKGLRHVIQGEPDENFILRDDFNRGVRAMRDSGLVYDILIFERHLPKTIEFVDRHPNQAFVLDHIAKPRIAEGVFEPWAARMKDLGKRENVSCKLSGLVTEANWKQWTPEKLKPYLDVVVQSFGTKRLMVGSDWPVCLVACGYTQWFAVLEEYFTDFSGPEREAIWGGNAERVYGL